MPVNEIYGETERLMKKTIERLQGDMATIRTGRATPALLEPVRVNYYGAQVPVSQVGTLAISEGRTIEIRPWDMSVLPELEKAILAANLGVTPNNDGKVMRLTLPPLSEDRRKELVKIVKKVAEDFRVSIRNERRDAMEKLKKEEKDGKLSKDVLLQAESRIQGLTDSYIKKVEEIISNKEKEVLEI